MNFFSKKKIMMRKFQKKINFFIHIFRNRRMKKIRQGKNEINIGKAYYKEKTL